MPKIEPVETAAVFGGGAFGTCLATLLARKGASKVTVWHPFSDDVDRINATRKNEKYLPAAKLQDSIMFSSDMKAVAASRAQVVVFAIPTQFFRKFLSDNREAVSALTETADIVVVASKGIERETCKLPAEILEGEIRGVVPRLVVFAGPSFAIEVATDQLTAVTVASENIEVARRAQRLLSTASGSLRCYASTDVVTAELSSAMKNVIALAAGAAEGLGFGRNARAYAITSGITEIVRLSNALADKRGKTRGSVLTLAGVGDVVLTCTSSRSRNFRVGKRLGAGESLEEIKRSTTAVAEGIQTSLSLRRLARRLGVQLQLCEAVYQVVSGQRSARESLAKLLAAPLIDEPLSKSAL